MSNEKKRKVFEIEGLPSFVKIDKTYAEINVSDIQYTENRKQFADAIRLLNENGYVLSGTSHTLGYYDAVEDITIEFNKTKQP